MNGTIVKWILAIVIGFFLYASASAQTNTGILQIILDVSQLSGNCNLAGVDTVYMHSGVGWTNPDSVWETIVGDWGIDDGKGEMTQIGFDSFSICFNVVDYYSTQADPDSTHVGGVGYGPMPTTATPYNIGCVFRTASCPINTGTGKPECTNPQTGKDENCENIYILGINNAATMQVIDNGGNPFSAVTALYVNQCFDSSTTPAGIRNPGAGIANVRSYPVPFNNMVWMDFYLMGGQGARLEILDITGRKVADLSSAIHPGSNSVVWKGSDSNGAPVPGGIYMYRITSDSQVYTGKVIKQ